ncbi:hypothetical protein ACLBSQ_33350, partial [Klebsiella pneumoniae]
MVASVWFVVRQKVSIAASVVSTCSNELLVCSPLQEAVCRNHAVRRAATGIDQISHQLKRLKYSYTYKLL